MPPAKPAAESRRRPWTGQIYNVVVLMLENRSFDNVLAWLYEKKSPDTIHFLPKGTPPFYKGLTEGTLHEDANPLTIDGVTEQVSPVKGTTANLINGVSYCNSPSADPHERFEHVTLQLYGPFPPTKPVPFAGPAPAGSPDMKGFLQDYWSIVQEEFSEESLDEKKARVRQVLETHTPETLPVLNALGKHYAVSDLWFASVPTQTNPNRAFMACGTSLGQVNNQGKYDQGCFDTPTLWNVLQGHATWKIFWQERYPPPPLSHFRAPDIGACLAGSSGSR